MQFDSEEMVWLAGGVRLPRVVIDFAFNLELRGVTLKVDGADLIVAPRTLLTVDDYGAIRRWKWQLRTLVTYQPPSPGWLQ